MIRAHAAQARSTKSVTARDTYLDRCLRQDSENLNYDWPRVRARPILFNMAGNFFDSSQFTDGASFSITDSGKSQIFCERVVLDAPQLEESSVAEG